jgi:hypothetical protein
MSLATIVKGNTFSLAIPLQVYAVEDGEVVLRDYTPESGDNITIRLKGDRRNYTYIPSTNGNIAYIHLEGSEVVGVYAVEVEIVKDDDSKLSSMRFEQLSIVESIDELNEGQITDGIEQGAIYLDPEIFIAGKDGRGIVSIVKTATSGLVDTYTITYTDNTTSTFNVTNGKDGENGQDGQDGADGVGIVSITKTSSVGLVDTYTILFTNGTTTTFNVTNGSNATQVQSDWAQTDSRVVDYIKNKPTIDNAPTQNSTNLVSSGGVYSAIEPKLEYYDLTSDTNLAPIWQAYMGGGTISDQQAFNAACEYLLSKMYEINSNTIFLLDSNACLKAFYEGYPITSPSYNPNDSCCVYFEFATEYQGAVTYNVVGVERNITDGITWGWYTNNSETELQSKLTSLTDSDIRTGTSQILKGVTAKVMHDNCYIPEISGVIPLNLDPNKIYDFGTISSALTIPDFSTSNGDLVGLVGNALNFYALRFIAGADNISITFPTGVEVDDTPTINTGDYVEIMINKYGGNFYASIKVWQAQS